MTKDAQRLYDPVDHMDFNQHDFSEEKLLAFKRKDDRIIKIAGKLLITTSALLILIFALANSVEAKTIIRASKRKSKTITLKDLENMRKNDLHKEVKKSLSYADKLNIRVSKERVRKAKILQKLKAKKWQLKINKILGLERLKNFKVDAPVKWEISPQKLMEHQSYNLNIQRVRKLNLIKGGATKLINLFSLFQVQKVLFKEKTYIKEKREEEKDIYTEYDDIFGENNNISKILGTISANNFTTILFSICLIIGNFNRKKFKEKKSEIILSDNTKKENNNYEEEVQSFYSAFFNCIMSHKYKVILVSILSFYIAYLILQTGKKKANLNVKVFEKGTQLIKQFNHYNFKIYTKLFKFREKTEAFLNIKKLKPIDSKLITKRITKEYVEKPRKRDRFSTVLNTQNFEIANAIRNVSTSSLEILLNEKNNLDEKSFKKITEKSLSYFINKLYLLLEDKKNKQE